MELAKRYNIILDHKRGNSVPKIDIINTDVNSIFFHIKITRDGKKVSIPEDATVLMYFDKNKTSKVVQSTIDGSIGVVDGEILCRVMTQSIGIDGKTEVEVKIKHKDQIITPSLFAFSPRKSLICDNDIESADEFPLLLELINRVEKIQNNADNIFGESEVIELSNISNIPTPFGYYYSGGFGVSGFGDGVFGGSDMISVPLKVRIKGNGVVHIQPNDKFKDLKILSVQQSNEGVFVEYSDGVGIQILL